MSLYLYFFDIISIIVVIDNYIYAYICAFVNLHILHALVK